MTGHLVTPTYIVLFPLNTKSLLQLFHLERLLYALNNSRFMTGEFFPVWIRTILLPCVNNRRTSPLHHALLICDAHSF